MRAMVLAAGLGTRLRPLTNDRPKALVEVAGRTLLEITLERLRSFGVHDVIVNAHHFAEMIVDYLNAHDNFGMHIEVSREDELLDTGGGIKKAAWFFLDSGNRDEPFLLHNVDVISSIDLGELLKLHRDQKALATLAVQRRATLRSLLFDTSGQLCGRQVGNDGTKEMVRPVEGAEALAFTGIHAISPALLAKMNEDGAFSIISTYLRLAGEGEKIAAFNADDSYWRDLGTPENIAQAQRDLTSGVLS